MAYQRGSLKPVKRKEGLTWILRYRVTKADGSRVENAATVGLVKDFPRESDARKEVDRLGILVKINADQVQVGSLKFEQLAEFYLRVELDPNVAVRPKSKNTKPILEHNVRDWLVSRWGKQVAEDIKPLEIQSWLKSLRNPMLNGDGSVGRKELSWSTISKLRGTMSRIYKIGIVHEKVKSNPVENVETQSKSSYKAIIVSPQQTLAILKSLASILHFTLVLTVAATALRASEILSLRWSDIKWLENRIRVSKRWAHGGGDGETKTEASDGYVAMHPVLAYHLRQWHHETPYARDTDFVFASLKMRGRVPLSACAFVKDFLRPAAITAGVEVPKGYRFGLHNLRHSLSNWLTNKAKVEPKTVQGMLRHSKIETTMNLYTQDDNDNKVEAQGRYLEALGVESKNVQ
jgi:integrase